jgi:uncharacterized protein (DUF427 family)
MIAPVRVTPGPDQESVWDYPRPPRVERFQGRIQVVYNAVTIANTRAARRVLETSHPPVYYLPVTDVRMDLLHPLSKWSWCEWKGSAVYFDVRVGEAVASAAAWAYSALPPEYHQLEDCVAFYAGPMDACLVDGQPAVAQPGGFYGGWITPNIVGPFKGTPGTHFW